MLTDEILRRPGPWIAISGVLGFAAIIGVAVTSNGNAPLWVYMIPAIAIPVLCLWWRRQWELDHPSEATDEDELD